MNIDIKKPRPYHLNSMETFKGTFLPHQVDGVRWMCRQEALNVAAGGILADEPGMGKTIMTIGLMLSNPRKTLIISPKSVATQWVEEIARFSTIPAILVSKHTKRPVGLDREDAAIAVVTSYGAFQRIKEDRVPWLVTEQWDRIICDEGHVMRNTKTQIYAGISKMSALSRFVLTGTPIQNKEKELRTLSHWIGFDGENAREICRAIVMRRTIDDVPNFKLPNLNIEVCPVEFDAKERELYELVEDYARRQATEGLSTGNHMDVLEAILRCRQICTHPQLFIEGMRKKLTVDVEDRFDEQLLREDWTEKSSKHKTLCNLVSAHSATDKSIVFCSFVHEMELCRQALEDVGIKATMFHGRLDDAERAQVVSQFRSDDSVRVLLAQILCGGTGLNLQVANHIYIMSPQYNPTWEVQALGRCFRHGQTKEVHFTRLVMNESIEGNICEVSERKLLLISRALGDPRIEGKLGKRAAGLTQGDVRTIFRKKRATLQQ